LTAPILFAIRWHGNSVIFILVGGGPPV